MLPARYANAPIALISLNYNLNYERAIISIALQTAECGFYLDLLKLLQTSLALSF